MSQRQKRRSGKALNFQPHFITLPRAGSGQLAQATGFSQWTVPSPGFWKDTWSVKVSVTTHVACRSPRASWWFMWVHCFRRT